MKIIHLALAASLGTGLILSAGAQQPDTAATQPSIPTRAAPPIRRKARRTRNTTKVIGIGHTKTPGNYPMPGTAPSPSPAG